MKNPPLPEAPVVALSLIQWSGVGYVLRDPETGEGRYELTGGLSGGMTVNAALDQADVWMKIFIRNGRPTNGPQFGMIMFLCHKGDET